MWRQTLTSPSNSQWTFETPYMVLGRWIVKSGVLILGLVGPKAPIVLGTKIFKWYCLKKFERFKISLDSLKNWLIKSFQGKKRKKRKRKSSKKFVEIKKFEFRKWFLFKIDLNLYLGIFLLRDLLWRYAIIQCFVFIFIWNLGILFYFATSMTLSNPSMFCLFFNWFEFGI